MKISYKNAWVGSLALSADILSLKWVMHWFTEGKEPSWYYLIEFLVCFAGLFAIDCIYQMLKKK